MSFEERTKNKSYLYKGKILNVRKDDVVLPDGKNAVREIIEHNGGSAVLCEKDGKILMVRQFRYAYQKELLEIPAGKLNEGEDPMETAIRELEEEGGIKADKMELLFEVYPTPGYSNEIIRIYQAVEFHETAMHLDEDEFLSSEWIDKKELKKMIRNKEIKDAKTLIALSYAIFEG
ncbi:MAG: NUDIX hydrolase [Clostridia bacterium]|nr:NUDIX hydrolase [Clostridia bacterium]